MHVPVCAFVYMFVYICIYTKVCIFQTTSTLAVLYDKGWNIRPNIFLGHMEPSVNWIRVKTSEQNSNDLDVLLENNTWCKIHIITSYIYVIYIINIIIYFWRKEFQSELFGNFMFSVEIDLNQCLSVFLHQNSACPILNLAPSYFHLLSSSLHF